MLCITCQAMDETTILNFRHLLERHGLTEAIFAEVNAHLTDKGITLRSGTLVVDFHAEVSRLSG
jgi:IS5 family transposase